MKREKKACPAHINRAAKTVTAMIGTVFGLSGFVHGLLETMQGYTPTNGLFIEAIGEAQRMWEFGREPAFTLIPNFLITGIAAMIVSIAAIVWSIGFMHRKNAHLVFLLLFTASLFVGAGVAQVLIFPIIWAFSTRIRKPLITWRKLLKGRVRSVLARIWAPLAAISAICILYALQVAVSGYVFGASDPDVKSAAMLISLGAGVALMLAAYTAAFASDISKGGAQYEKVSGGICVEARSNG